MVTDVGEEGKKGKYPLSTFAGDFSAFSSMKKKFEEEIGGVNDLLLYSMSSFSTFKEVKVEEAFEATFCKLGFGLLTRNWWKEAVGEGNPCEYPVDYIIQDLMESAKMVFYDKELKKMVYRSPDDTWVTFSGFFPLLWAQSDDSVPHWNFSLPTVYYQGLTEEVKMKVIEKKEDGGYAYKLPTADKLTTKTEQISYVRELKCKASGAFDALKKQESVVRNWVFRASNSAQKGKRSIPSHSQLGEVLSECEQGVDGSQEAAVQGEATDLGPAELYMPEALK
jgi:hypothetical protein